MKLKKILIIILIINFITFSFMDIVFAVTIDNIINTETKIEEQEILNEEQESLKDFEIKETEDVKQIEDSENIDGTEEGNDVGENEETDKNGDIENLENPTDNEINDELNVENDKEEIKENTEEIENIGVKEEQSVLLTMEENNLSQLIENGTYIIITALNPNKVIDISNASTSNGANVQIWQNSNVKQQQFRITYTNGYYEIESVKSRKKLDVLNGGNLNGTNVQQWQSNGSDAQKWEIKDAGNGYYHIISKCNNLYLDVLNGNTLNGTNIQMYSKTGSPAQKFTFKKIEEKIEPRTIEDGLYEISTALNSNKLLDVSGGSISNGANVQIWQRSVVKQQRFKITYNSNGYYEIRALHSNKLLDVTNEGMEKGTNIQQWQSTTSDAQKWIIKDAGNGYYNIISKLNDLYLDVLNENTANGTNVQVYDYTGSKAQKFIFKKVEEIIPKKTINTGVYEISTALDSNKVLDISEGSISNGANVQIWSNDNVSQQKFRVLYAGNGYYEIQSFKSNKLLDVLNAEKTNGTNVQQWQNNGTDAQKWIIQDAGDGYYYIISKCNELYLDVSNGATANGTNVQMYSKTGTARQKFKFNTLKSTQVIKDGTYEISTALNSKVVLDIKNGSTVAGANVQIWQSDNVQQQKFKLLYNKEGYYIIQSSKSGKVLEVANSGMKSGTNVIQNTSNNSDKQKWIIKSAGNGYCYIVSRYNGLYLDVAGGSTKNGTNVQVYEGNSSKAQKFKFKEGYMGIDVSAHQGSINWTSVKNTGIDFAMLRIGGRYYGSGLVYEDKMFSKNVIGTKANNIDIGIYFYSQAITIKEAQEEANFVVNTLKKYNVNVTYPVTIDTEWSSGRADSLSAKERTDICIEFLEIIKDSGYIPMIYSNKDWLLNNLELSRLSSYDVWLAHYAKETDYKNPYTMWQYTSSGSVSGITGNVDMNICYKKYF